MKRYLPFLIIAGVLIIAVVAGIALWKSSKQAQEQPPGQSFAQSTPQASPSQSTQATQTPQPSPVQLPPDNPHARGGLNAKVTLDEYGDYQCPPCGALYPELKTLEKDYGDQVRFVFHQFPLPTVHKHAELAARAAEAAGLQGKFWEMHDMLYQNQLSWSIAEDARPVFIQYAQMLGLDVDRFTRDLDSYEVKSRVDIDVERGKSLGVQGTPTVFINGRQLKPEVMTDEGLRLALDYMLGKKK
ncbi:MAG TPA: thioredoxin domain-containing protein [Pyrinomonadaceae bacterium]|nr:thioredoxin domain-containing protein [Pyrinomonadaceae bacterium]